MAITTRSRNDHATFYKEEADSGSYLSPAYNQDILHELIAQIPVDQVRTVGDIGSGAGSNLPTLKAAFPASTLIALDLSSKALQLGRKAVSTVIPTQSDATALPLAGGSLDLAICTEVLEHVHSLQTAVDEIARVVRPGGYAAISSPNYLNPMGLRKWWKDRKMGESYWDPWGGHPGFERLMLPRLVKRALHGRFDIRSVSGAGYLMAWIPLGYRRIGHAHDEYPLRWLGRLRPFRDMAMNRYLLLQKPGRRC